MKNNSLKSTYKVENKAYHSAMVELRRSNATTPHEDRRTRRQRTRQAAKRHSIKESW